MRNKDIYIYKTRQDIAEILLMSTNQSINQSINQYIKKILSNSMTWPNYATFSFIMVRMKLSGRKHKVDQDNGTVFTCYFEM